MLTCPLNCTCSQTPEVPVKQRADAEVRSRFRWARCAPCRPQRAASRRPHRAHRGCRHPEARPRAPVPTQSLPCVRPRAPGASEGLRGSVVRVRWSAWPRRVFNGGRQTTAHAASSAVTSPPPVLRSLRRHLGVATWL